MIYTLNCPYYSLTILRSAAGATATDPNPMNRSILASAAVAHVRRLSDPYGPIGTLNTVGAVTVVGANSSSSAAHGKMTVGGSGVSGRRVQSCPHLSTSDSLLFMPPPAPGTYNSSSTASDSSTTMTSTTAMMQHDPPVDETNPKTSTTMTTTGAMDTESGNATLAAAETTNPTAATVS